MSLNENNIEPFLKWAGGKRWLVKKHSNVFPKKFNRYIEPFLGSGAVYFYLRPDHGILSDANGDLINTYLAIRDDYESVEKLLHSYQKKHSKEFYYEMRDKQCRTLVTKAAKFLYLNRTCWNGLYRVNLKGEFNVPIGTKTNVLLDTDNFKAISTLLQSTQIFHQDFEKSIDEAEDGDFVFIDPPYTVKHNTNGFIKYNENLFSWDDQIRLKNAVIRARERGAQIMMTNADHDSIRTLYSGENFSSMYRSSVIAASSDKRGKYTELLIRF